MRKKEEERILTYLEALEDINQQLVVTLRNCLQLLAHIQPAASDQERWQGMLDDIKRILQAGERIKTEKTLH